MAGLIDHKGKLDVTHSILHSFLGTCSYLTNKGLLLTTLIAAGHPELFTSETMRALLRFKWRAFAGRIFLQRFLLYLLNFILLIGMDCNLIESNVTQRLLLLSKKRTRTKPSLTSLTAT